MCAWKVKVILGYDRVIGSSGRHSMASQNYSETVNSEGQIKLENVGMEGHSSSRH